MRPQQQNRRMRGRNNNNSNTGGNNNNNNQNRKGPNPLTRSYESNGPDVKIRGSAQQIADKYMQLARDAQSSSDRVMAENYLQHAEHYNRIIAAAQAQMPAPMNRDARDDMDDDEERDGFDQQSSFEPRQQPNGNDGSGPQPEISGVPAEVALNPEAAGAEQPREQRPLNGHNNGVEARDGEEGPRRSRRRRGRRPDGEARSDSAEDDNETGGNVEADGDNLPSFVTAGRTQPPAAPKPDKGEEREEPQPADVAE